MALGILQGACNDGDVVCVSWWVSVLWWVFSGNCWTGSIISAGAGAGSDIRFEDASGEFKCAGDINGFAGDLTWNNSLINLRFLVTIMPDPSILMRYFLNGNCSTTMPVLSQRLCLFVPKFWMTIDLPGWIGFSSFNERSACGAVDILTSLGFANSVHFGHNL